MAKYWEPGKVKTRLGASAGMELSAELQHIFLRHLCQTLCDAGERRAIVASPENRLQQFRSELAVWNCASDWTVNPQGHGDLGDRMQRWLRKNMDQDDVGGAVVIGADCPTIASDDIQIASETLGSHDVVIGPAVDGGYYLLGLRGPWNDSYRGLFEDVPWGTQEVLRITKQRLSANGLSLALLELKQDIDTIAELNALRVWLAQTQQIPDLLRQINETLQAGRDDEGS